MKKAVLILLFTFIGIVYSFSAGAQCAVCTKTASQLGEKPAQGMNSGILYLMLMPFAIVGFISYRWWKSNRKFEEQEGSVGAPAVQ